MKIEEAYKTMQEASGIKVGDKVKVLRANERDELGSNTCYHTESELDYNGRDGVVIGIDSNGVSIELPTGRIYRIPFFVLEVVEKAKIIRKEVRYYDENNKDVTDQLSELSKQNLSKGE